MIAAWRVLIGVWGPRDWDLPIASLKTYTKFTPPPPNPWLDVNKPPKDAPPPPPAESNPTAEETKLSKPKRKVASRHLVRHVLRARISASQSLSKFLAEINRSGGDVRASAHLAARYSTSYGGASDVAKTAQESSQFLPVDGPTGVRSAREVVRYLKEHGAQIGDLDNASEGDWAAEHLSSGDEGGEVRRSYLQ